MADFRYRPEVDGLRAISVLAVIAFHAGFGCPGGYVGVDVFFVISGYLITSLILRDLQAGTFSLSNFWARRIRRIVPAASFMVLSVLAAGYVLLLPVDLESLGASALAQASFLANIYFWRDAGYFTRTAETEPLLHTWSLAVEEQFYLGFPLLMSLLRRASRRAIMATLAAIAIASFAASVYGTFRHPSATFYLLPTRAWELLVGSLFALYQPPVAATSQSSRPPRSAELAAWVGMALIVGSILLFDSRTPFPGAAAMAPVLGAGLFIHANANQLTSIGRVLSLRPLVFIGLVSYSLYLWHWPVIALVRYVHDEAEPGGLVMASTLLAAACLAILAWLLVEEPIRRKRLFARMPRLIAATAASLALVAVIAGAMVHSGGLPGRLPTEWKITNSMPRGEIEDYRNGRPRLIGDEADSSRPAFIVWGDSHAGMMLPAFDDAARQFQVSGFNAAKGGRPPIPGVSISWDKDLPEWNDLVLDFIKSRRVPHVFLVARWSQFIEGASPYQASIGENPSRPLISCDGTAARPDFDSAAVCFRSGLERLIRELRPTGCTIWIVRQVPDQPCDVLLHRFLQRSCIGAGDKAGTSLEAYQQRQRRVDEIFESLASEKVRVISVHEKLFDGGGKGITADNGVPLFSDSHHLSVDGVEKIVRPVIVRIMATVAESADSGTAGDTESGFKRPEE